MSQNKFFTKKTIETDLNNPKIEELSIKEEGKELKKMKKRQVNHLIQ
jgi:hypothetical protein